MPAASKCYVAWLGLTALTAVNDLVAGQLLGMETVPLWINMAVNTAYFVVNIITTSAFALILSYADQTLAEEQRGLLWDFLGQEMVSRSDRSLLIM